MTEFLEKTFYNNSISEWLIALSIISGAYFLAKLVYFVLNRVVGKLTKKTKTKIDDIIIDMVEEPVVFAMVITGFWYASEQLNLTEAVVDFRSKVMYILITFNVAWVVARLIDALIVEYLKPMVDKSEGDLDDQLLPIIRKTLKALIWTIAIVVGLTNAGYDVGALIAGLGIGGLALAMAAKDTVANLFGGVTIFTDKPFKLGDRVKVAGYDGNIKEIGIRSTRLVTLEGRTVTIPNSTFTDGAIENVSSEPSRKVVSTFGMTYDTSAKDMVKAQEILREIVSKNNSIQDNITIAFSGFGDFSLNILLIYYIKSGEDNMAVQNEVNLEILESFNREKLEFAFPTQTIINQQS